jgi:hypothetical protein
MRFKDNINRLVKEYRLIKTTVQQPVIMQVEKYKMQGSGHGC